MKKKKLKTVIGFPEGLDRKEKLALISMAIDGVVRCKIKSGILTGLVGASSLAIFILASLTGFLSNFQTILIAIPAALTAITYRVYLFTDTMGKKNRNEIGYPMIALFALMSVLAYMIAAVKLSDAPARYRENIIFLIALLFLLIFVQEIRQFVNISFIETALKEQHDQLAAETEEQ